jgi:hypothetical protein
VALFHGDQGLSVITIAVVELSPARFRAVAWKPASVPTVYQPAKHGMAGKVKSKPTASQV